MNDTEVLPESDTEDEAVLALELPAPPEVFAIRDEVSAAWLVRKISEARAYVAKVRAWAHREERRALREEEFFMGRYGAQLEAWCRGEVAKLKGRRKSLNLPGGSVGFRRVEAKLVIDDEAEVLTWARQHLPGAVTSVEKLSKSAINKHFENTGEVPEAGAHVESERDNFYVK